MPKTLTDRERAVELEQDAVRYPDERGEILHEAAIAWKEAGEPERAIELWRELTEAGGTDAGYARYNLAEFYFEQDRDAEAEEHLRALAEAGEVDAGPAGLVAELLAERGDHEAALHWFDMAIGALDADEVAAVGTADGIPSMNAGLFFGRQECRKRLGLPADELDRIADVAEQNRLDFVRLVERKVNAIKHSGSPETTMLVWQREEQRQAAFRWPAVFPPETIGHHPEVEQRLRDICQRDGITRITLVLGSVEGFAAYLDEMGGDPDEEKVRLAYAERAYAAGRQLSWPPGRNEPCWCGSSRKYKKCCGDPRSAGI
jgi:tetratricopeptide (TPR) repeat protein